MLVDGGIDMAIGDQMYGNDKQAMKREAAARNNRYARQKRVGNVSRATMVGAGSGVAGSVVISWLSAEGEKRYGIPLAVTASVLGTAFTFVARWAAKLLPDGS